VVLDVFAVYFGSVRLTDRKTRCSREKITNRAAKLARDNALIHSE